jgi:hypothetical protein
MRLPTAFYSQKRSSECCSGLSNPETTVLGTLVDPEPMALATGVDVAAFSPMAPEASAYGSGKARFSASHQRNLFVHSALVGICLSGCTAPWTQKAPKSELEKKTESVQEVLQSEERPRLVGEAASLLWMDIHEYEGFGLVNGLPETGGDVKPSQQRDYILRELRANNVDKPNEVLASKATALVRMKMYANPGVAKGEATDVIVELSDQCEATSLRNGWLMPSRIMEMQLVGNQTKSSDIKARASGPLVILPTCITKEDSVNVTRAVILGGARMVEGRKFGLRVKESVRHATTSAAISRAINDRYFFHNGSERKGVASSKNDSLIMLETPSKFNWDVQHYTDVLLSIVFLENRTELEERMDKCRQRMNEPTIARQACLELEAIGKEAIPILEKGLTSSDRELRFYAAYSLAYLYHPAAAPVLAELAKTVPEFRPLCLTGLQVLDHFSAKDQLETLLQDPEPETRYGALLALRNRNPRDLSVRGQPIGEMTNFVMIPSSVPLVAVSLEQRPEVAVFGDSPAVNMQGYFEINPRLTMRRDENGQIYLVRFQKGDEDLVARVAPDCLSVLEGIRTVGGTYNDVIVWLDEAKRNNWIEAPIEFNPKPHAGRVYHRNGPEKNTEKDIERDTASNEVKTDIVTDAESSESKSNWWFW